MRFSSEPEAGPSSTENSPWRRRPALPGSVGRQENRTAPIYSRVAVIVGLLVAASAAFGQVAPKRLSDWLLEQPYSSDAYPLGLSWRVPEERSSQALLRRDLLTSLSGFDRDVAADPASVIALR